MNPAFKIEPELLRTVACPRCDHRPGLTQKDQYLVCPDCGAKYPIVDGIPQLLPEDAEFENQSKS
ncbi:MAG: Trm112 family protein [Armatimonadetes bacterium]|nr:Trm112 family protein [Armatimonadota bacterium]